VDIIVVYGSTAAQAARRATSQIPIVIVSAGDPVALGLVASLPRPGANVTGLTSMGRHADARRFQLLRELVPTLRSMAVVLFPESASETASLHNYQSYARPLGIEVHAVHLSSAADIDVAVPSIKKLNVQGVMVVSSSIFATHPKRLVAAVNTLRLPAVYSNQAVADAGGLLVYAPDVLENFARVSTYIDKILKGAKPADLPIEQSSNWTLVLNRQAARDLGLTIPPSVLAGAEVR
jgi:putative ABC transport system substrate-binding protein